MEPNYGFVTALFEPCDDSNLPRTVGALDNGLLTTNISQEKVIPLTKFDVTLVEPLEEIQGNLLGKIRLIDKYILP